MALRARNDRCHCGKFPVGGACVTCDWGHNPSGDGMRPHRSVIGTRRQSYEEWARAFTPYEWPLWRNWTKPMPVKVETVAQVRRRQIQHKPSILVSGGQITVPYPWKLWHQHKQAKGA